MYAVASRKGGASKTTTAIHLAAWLQTLAPTILIDSDPNRSATAWGRKGKLPFEIADGNEGIYKARQFEHVVIDTEARPGQADIDQLAKGCDLLIIPAVPATLDTDALVLTIGDVHRIAPNKYRVLLAKVPPPPEQDGPVLRAELTRQGIPIFTSEIPRLKAFEKAAAEGVIVQAVDDPRALRAWQAYAEVGKEIMNAQRGEVRRAV